MRTVIADSNTASRVNQHTDIIMVINRRKILQGCQSAGVPAHLHVVILNTFPSVLTQIARPSGYADDAATIQAAAKIAGVKADHEEYAAGVQLLIGWMGKNGLLPSLPDEVAEVAVDKAATKVALDAVADAIPTALANEPKEVRDAVEEAFAETRETMLNEGVGTVTKADARKARTKKN